MTPTPDEIRQARELAGLSQPAAAALIYSTKRTWQDWEAGVAKMHPGLFELFQIKVGVSIIQLVQRKTGISLPLKAAITD